MFELLTFYPFGMFLKLCDSFTNDFDKFFLLLKLCDLFINDFDIIFLGYFVERLF